MDELLESAITQLITEEHDLVVYVIQKKYPNTTDLTKFIGDFFDEDSNDEEVDEGEYTEADKQKLIEYYGCATISQSTMEFCLWIDEGMPRRN